MCTCLNHARLRFGLPVNERVNRCLSGEEFPRRSFLTAAGAAAVTAALPLRVIAARAAGQAIRYDYVTSGVVKGSQVTTILPDGSIDVRFSFNDRGRGPSIRSRIVVDDAGFISHLRTSGYDYLKTPVAETFSAARGVAQWRNASEHETKQSAHERFYISLNGSPEEGAILARAALRRPQLPLWPDGVSTIRRVRTMPVSNGEQHKRISMYELNGLDFEPDPIWLDDDGRLFMAGSQWGALIPAGWRSVLPSLLSAQDARTSERGAEIARSLHTVGATALAITRAAVFDAVSGAMTRDASVLVKGDCIVATGHNVEIPSDARHIDGVAKTVLPGLWNMHMHLAAEFGPRLLAEGVTTIRDPGNDPEYIQRVQQQFASGTLLGPRVIIAGLMDGKGKYTAPIGTTADTPAEALAQVHDWKRRGAVQIKMYSSLSPSLVPLVAKEAHGLGMRVSGHIPAGMIAQDAIEAGFDEVQHVNMLFLNFMPDVKDRTQTPIRLTVPAQRSGTIDLNGTAVRDFIALMKQRDIVSDPTLGVFYFDAVQRAGGSAPMLDIVDWLPAQTRRGWVANSFPPPTAEKKAAYLASAQAFLNMVKLLHDNGIRIVAGTDDVLPGFDTIAELELYAKAGISHAHVLQTATIAAARVMKMEDRVGTIAPGMLADLIVVAGDPLSDISALRRVKTTIKDGVAYDTRQLYATAGVRAPAVA